MKGDNNLDTFEQSRNNFFNDYLDKKIDQIREENAKFLSEFREENSIIIKSIKDENKDLIAEIKRVTSRINIHPLLDFVKKFRVKIIQE